MKFGSMRPSWLAGLLLAAAIGIAGTAGAADLKGGTLRVAVLQDIVNFDPLQYSSVNYPLTRNLYDPLLEYTPDGKAVPGVAESWQIAPDNGALTLKLRGEVTFTDGVPLTADAVAATLKKAADPAKGKNVYPTMAIVKNWVVNDPHSITLNFTNPVPDRQITDLVQAISPTFFTFNGTYVTAVHADSSLIGPATLYPGSSMPAQPGETILLFANGFGPTSTAVVGGVNAQSGSLPTLPVVTIGGIPANVRFAGLISPGLFQFNVDVPATAPAGDNTYSPGPISFKTDKDTSA